MSVGESLLAIPVSDRPSRTKSRLRLLSFNVLFFVSLLILHSSQLLFFPLLFFKATFDDLLWIINSFAKQVFAIVLVSLAQIFGPSTLVITVDEHLDLRLMVRRDPVTARVLALDLPKRSVIIANHQIYADWLYIWCLAYLGEIHSSIVIILKASLKWVPVIGPAMQLFSFIFLNRSWSSDKISLTSHLTSIARRVSNPQKPQSLALLIFPEGTLVSPLTRPISKRYSDLKGYPELDHCLLPRSTGSLFSIRALARSIPDLKLIDLTLGYPGIPAHGNGQDFYTLQSIFGYGHSPPEVHIHIRLIPVSEIPLGNYSESSSSEPTVEEALAFDQWLRSQWSAKDAMLQNFYQTGRLVSSFTSPEEKDDDHNGKVKNPGGDKVWKNRLETKIRLRPGCDGLLLFTLYAPGIFLVWATWVCLWKPLFRFLF